MEKVLADAAAAQREAVKQADLADAAKKEAVKRAAVAAAAQRKQELQDRREAEEDRRRVETNMKLQALKQAEQKRKDQFVKREIAKQEKFEEEARKSLAKHHKEVAIAKEKSRLADLKAAADKIKKEEQAREKAHKKMMKDEAKAFGKYGKME